MLLCASGRLTGVRRGRRSQVTPHVPYRAGALRAVSALANVAEAHRPRARATTTRTAPVHLSAAGARGGLHRAYHPRRHAEQPRRRPRRGAVPRRHVSALRLRLPPAAAAAQTASAAGRYVIGKEKILQEVARRCGCRICVPAAKMGVVRRLQLEAPPEDSARQDGQEHERESERQGQQHFGQQDEDSSRAGGGGGSGGSIFTTDAAASRVHVVSWGALGESFPFFRPDWPHVEELAAQAGVARVVAFVPTGECAALDHTRSEQGPPARTIVVNCALQSPKRRTCISQRRRYERCK
eukprot:scaffold533_cov369-Prasinococcus_capsulatus_cf.AAC.21